MADEVDEPVIECSLYMIAIIIGCGSIVFVLLTTSRRLRIHK